MGDILALIGAEWCKLISMDQPLQPVGEKTAAGIPLSLAPCFQEYVLERIDPAQHADLVIERVLANGDRRELRWLFDRYGRASITNWVQQLGARRLPWRRYNLWCVLLELPAARRLRSDEGQIWPH